MIFRLLALFGPYHGDINNHVAWAKMAWKSGFKGFYDQVLFEGVSKPNYPPLAVLSFIGVYKFYQLTFSFFWNLNNLLPLFPSKLIPWLENNGLQAMMKLPTILADLGTGWLIFRLLEAKKRKNVLFWTASYLFNPAVFYLSSVWGQLESLVMFWTLAAVFLLSKKKLEWGTGAYILSLLVKPLALIFSPLIFILLCYRRPKFTIWLKLILVAILLVLFFSLPFYVGEPFTWFGSFYLKNLSGPPKMFYLTANAFNFWSLFFGLSPLPDQNKFFVFSYRTWGFLITIPFLLTILINFWQKKDPERIFKAMLLTNLVIFLFMTRMHERYLYPAIPLLAIISSQSKNWSWVYLLFSLSFFLNLYHNWWQPMIPGLINLLQTPSIIKILAAINLITFFWLWWNFFKNKRLLKLKPINDFRR